MSVALAPSHLMSRATGREKDGKRRRWESHACQHSDRGVTRLRIVKAQIRHTTWNGLRSLVALSLTVSSAAIRV
jgi:hypothetical protein